MTIMATSRLMRIGVMYVNTSPNDDADDPATIANTLIIWLIYILSCVNQ